MKLHRLFSIITPIYETPADVLEIMVQSVISQSYPYWELCLVDDASKKPHVKEMLDAYALQDKRIRVQYRENNGGIIAASNDSLAMAKGEFVAFLDHDDELHPEALGKVNHILAQDGEIDYVYTDEDKINEFGLHRGPFFKPDWSPERFLTQMYTCHFGVMRRTLVEEVGGFRLGYEGSQDFD